jgi:hypothetical protein
VNAARLRKRICIAGDYMTVTKIISGGQTGADRAALDFAISAGVSHGGWCPKGRVALDGPLDPCYDLKEAPSSGYEQGTEWNVRDSDATLVFTLAARPAGGSRNTLQFAAETFKPCLHIHEGTATTEALRFLWQHQPSVLNIAGSREEREPGISLWTRAFLERLWRQAAPPPDLEP